MALFFKRDEEKNLEGYQEFLVDFMTKKRQLTELSLEIALNRIADVIAKCGFQVISAEDGEAVRDIEYTLNVKPNINQNATDFWKQAVRRMIADDEGCVIINMGPKGIFIADDWDTNDEVIKEKRYTNVVVTVDDDTLKLNKTFKASDVVHLRYTNPKLMQLLKAANYEMDDLFGAASAGMKAKTPIVAVKTSGVVKIQTEDGNVITTNQYAREIAKKMSAGEVASIVTGQGIDFNVIEGKTSLSSKDVADLRDIVFGNTAAAFGIPKNILFADVVNQSNSEFITYACEPMMRIIDNALCGTWLTREEYIRGDRIIVNKLCVKHIDVIESANNLDKLYSNGWSHNDILKLLGQPTIDEDWANARRFTKNYAEEGGEQ